jgi:hypothetical protein
MRQNKLMHILIAIMIVGGTGSVLTTAIMPSGNKTVEHMYMNGGNMPNTLPGNGDNQNNSNSNNSNNSNDNSSNNSSGNTTTAVTAETTTVSTAVGGGSVGTRFVELLRDLCITFFTGSTLMYLYLKFKNDPQKENYQFVNTDANYYQPYHENNVQMNNENNMNEEKQD